MIKLPEKAEGIDFAHPRRECPRLEDEANDGATEEFVGGGFCVHLPQDGSVSRREGLLTEESFA
jgi:hypothetical protein